MAKRKGWKPGNPGNKGGGRLPAPREIDLSKRGHLHPETVAEILGTSADRVREWIREKRLRSSFTWRGVSYVAAREVEHALVAGRLPGSEPGSGASTAPAFRGSPDTSRKEIGAPARSGGLRTEDERPNWSSWPIDLTGPTGPIDPPDPDLHGPSAPDFSETVAPLNARPYDPSDSKGLPALPRNWRELLEGVKYGPRLVEWVRLVWLEGLPVKEATQRAGLTDGTWRADKRRILEHCGLLELP